MDGKLDLENIETYYKKKKERLFIAHSERLLEEQRKYSWQLEDLYRARERDIEKWKRENEEVT